MIFKHFIEGGPLFMSVIYMMWIAVIVLTIRFLILYFNDNQSIKLKRTNDAILFFGSLTFLIGIFGQTIGIFMALSAIEAAGGVAPALIAGGLKVSMITALYGFGLLLSSAVIWFIFKNLLANKK
ncbi:MAG: MotA/TolQ/ExbB proton channel family protein [Bacteroidetes bacterium]|nr:MotA/TolQ/ExbB proton channel family protein [Bacteroidota bacterium]